MRNYGYDIALAEMDRIRAKIQDGRATQAEKLRYQQLLSHPQLFAQTRTNHQGGLSSGFSSGQIPIAPKGPAPSTQQGHDEKKKPKRKYTYKAPSVAATIPYVRPIATIMSRAKGSQEKMVFYDMYPAATLEEAVAKKNSPVQDEHPKTKPYHVRVIDPTKETKMSATAAATTVAPAKAPSPPQSSSGSKRVHAPVPVRGQQQQSSTKRQKVETKGVAAATAPSKGILRQTKPSAKSAANRKQPSLVSKIDPTVFLRAMRASAATRGQQEHILTAFRASSSSTDERRSAFESLQKRTAQDVKVREAQGMALPSQQSTKTAGAMGSGSRSPPTSRRASPQAKVPSPPVVKRKLSPPAQNSSSPVTKSSYKPIEKPPSPRSVEEEAKIRRLAGMKSTTAMLAQTLPPALVKKAIKTNPHMPTTHLLRRFGNPHRRVVHQMLRDQNEKIIRAMKKKQGNVTKSDASPKEDPVAAPAKAVAVAAK
ncbi:MAG: hypothetical protein SGILL_009797 [Bacillariaceae sp.]